MAAYLRTQSELQQVVQYWDETEHPGRAALAGALNRGLDDLKNGYTPQRVNVVRFNLYCILKDFTDEIMDKSFYCVSHFLKDASGFQVDFLPSIIMGSKAYRFSVFFEADPEDPSKTVSHILTRRHEPTEDLDEILVGVDYRHSQNYQASERIHDFRLEMQKEYVHNISNVVIYMAGQLGVNELLEHVKQFEESGGDLWTYVAK
jgi:hypothetical protein